MREGWKKKRLTDFVWFQRGFDLPKNKFEEGEIPVLGSTSILGMHNEAKVKGPGIVTGRSGTLGKFQYCKTDFWPHNTTLWIKDFKGNDKMFAYYLLQTLDFTIFNSGGAVPTLNRNLLYAYVVDIPPLPTQRKIASILSAYDDLIENNLKRIAILEEMAQQTYEEWFVRMRFPGYESAVINPETGLPEGWERVRLGDVAHINKSSLKKGFKGNIKYIDIASVSPNRINAFGNYDIEDAPGRARRIVREGDIIWSCVRPNRRSHALIINPGKDWIASTGFCVISSKKIPFVYLYHYLTTNEFVAYLTNLASGAAYPAVAACHFEEAHVVLASKELLMNFDKRIKSSKYLISNLQNQNQRLREARDILLPRLMMGMIDVDEVVMAEHQIKS